MLARKVHGGGVRVCVRVCVCVCEREMLRREMLVAHIISVPMHTGNSNNSIMQTQKSTNMPANAISYEAIHMLFIIWLSMHVVVPPPPSCLLLCEFVFLSCLLKVFMEDGTRVHVFGLFPNLEGNERHYAKHLAPQGVLGCFGVCCFRSLAGRS